MALPATPTPYMNEAAGLCLLALAAALALRTRDPAARLLALFLGLRGANYALFPLNWVLDPPWAQAVLNAAHVPLYFAFLPLALFASRLTGYHQGFWRHRATLAVALAMPLGLTALELAEPSPLWTWSAPGVWAGGPLAAWFELSGLLNAAAYTYAAMAIAWKLRRESDPAEMPVLGLLLAAVLPAAVALLRELVTLQARWVWTSAVGLPEPLLLPNEPWARVAFSVLACVAFAAVFRRAPSARAREAGLTAVALAALISAAVGFAATFTLENPNPAANPDLAALRWVFFGLLLTYAGLRHGFLGARRVASPAVELPLGAAGFGVLVALFVLALQRAFPDWAAVTGGFVLALVAGALTLALSGTPLPRATEARYREERVLGAGSQGKALLALDQRLHRPVVLKRLPPGTDALREARAAARVSHPGLVAIHDVHEDAAGAALVLEFMPGGTLEDRLRDGPLAPADVKRLGRTLAEALEALHAAGVVHGDVKASNVFFRADGQPALGDFGAARARRTAEATAASLAPVPIAGSLAGAAPEVLRGEVPEPTADVYGLGALLYRALTGEHYVRFAPTFEEARDAVLREPPRLPHPAVPARWEALLARALAKRPEDRFASARAFAAGLERVEA